MQRRITLSEHAPYDVIEWRHSVGVWHVTEARADVSPRSRRDVTVIVSLSRRAVELGRSRFPSIRTAKLFDYISYHIFQYSIHPLPQIALVCCADDHDDDDMAIIRTIQLNGNKQNNGIFSLLSRRLYWQIYSIHCKCTNLGQILRHRSFTLYLWRTKWIT